MCKTQPESGLPQDRLRALADKLEKMQPRECVHDIKLARALADALDKPRRDCSIGPIVETATNLIEMMSEYIEEGGY